MAIPKVTDPVVQKALGNLESGKADKKMKHFPSLDTSILDSIKEGESATADDGTNEYIVWVRNGKLFQFQGTEVT